MSAVATLTRNLIPHDYIWRMNTPLLHLPDKNIFALRDAYEGIFCTGGIGSGKTSSMATIARQYLLAGMGGMVLCCKNEEAPAWLKLARECGREKSIIHVQPDGQQRFNFLDYELHRPEGGGHIENIIGIFDVLKQAMDAQRSGTERKQDHWSDSAYEMLRHILVILIVARGRISIDDIISFYAEHSAERSANHRRGAGEQALS